MNRKLNLWIYMLFSEYQELRLFQKRQDLDEDLP
jgi:hypothetical protein